MCVFFTQNLECSVFVVYLRKIYSEKNMSIICVKLTDNIYADVNKIEIKYHYRGVLEAIPGALSRVAQYQEIPDIKRYIQKIQTGAIAGRYCLEPELMDEIDFWGPGTPEQRLSLCGKCIKEYEIEVELGIPQKDGHYAIVVEWFQSTKELSSTPLVELVRKEISNLSFEKLRTHCIYNDWEDLT